MEGKFKLRISRMFHNSCKSRDDVARDVIEKSPFLLSQSPTVPQPQPQSKPLPRPSICKPRTPPSLHINNTCIISSKEIRNMIPRRHQSREPSRNSKSKSPVPRFAVDPFYDRSGFCYYAVEEDNRKKKKKSKKKNTRNTAKSLPLFDDHDFFSSDDEREDDDDEKTADTLFSSRSLSSSESSFESCSRRRRRRSKRASRRKMAACDEGIGVLPMCVESDGVRGSFAVAKRSRDPYGDFRTSMVEMIIERQIFGEKELEQLLLCFLSLNSSHHHKVIVEVFTEIWDALFCNRS